MAQRRERAQRDCELCTLLAIKIGCRHQAIFASWAPGARPKQLQRACKVSLFSHRLSLYSWLAVLSNGLKPRLVHEWRAVVPRQPLPSDNAMVSAAVAQPEADALPRCCPRTNAPKLIMIVHAKPWLQCARRQGVRYHSSASSGAFQQRPLSAARNHLPRQARKLARAPPHLSDVLKPSSEGCCGACASIHLL